MPEGEGIGCRGRSGGRADGREKLKAQAVEGKNSDERGRARLGLGIHGSSGDAGDNGGKIEELQLSMWALEGPQESDNDK